MGEVDECRSWLGLDNENSPYRDPSIVTFVVEHSRDDKENDLLPGLCKLLETWLMEVVFPRFRETQSITFKLGDYYDDPMVLRYLERLEGVGGSPLAAAAAIARIGAEATAVLDSVKASAIQALQKVIPLGDGEASVRRNGNSFYTATESDELSLGHKTFPENTVGFAERSPSDDQEQEMITDKIKDDVVKITSAGVAVGLLTLFGLKFLPYRADSSILRKDGGSAVMSDVINVGMIQLSAFTFHFLCY